MSSIESAPHTIPAISARIFTAALAPPFATIFTCSTSSVLSPQRSANAITATNPAHDTRFGSSKRTPIARRAWDSRIQRMPFCAVVAVAVVSTSSQLRRAFVRYDAPYQRIRQWIQVQVDRFRDELLAVAGIESVRATGRSAPYWMW